MRDRATQARVRRGELDDVHPGERGAPDEDLVAVDVWLRDRPVDRGAVVLALAWHGGLEARLAAISMDLIDLSHGPLHGER